MRLKRPEKLNHFIRNNRNLLVVFLIGFIICVKLQFDIISLSQELETQKIELHRKTEEVLDFAQYVHLLEKSFQTVGGDFTSWGCSSIQPSPKDFVTQAKFGTIDEEDDDPSINNVRLLSLDAMMKIQDNKYAANFESPSKCIKDQLKIYPMKLMCSKFLFNYNDKYSYDTLPGEELIGQDEPDQHDDDDEGSHHTGNIDLSEQQHQQRQQRPNKHKTKVDKDSFKKGRANLSYKDISFSNGLINFASQVREVKQLFKEVLLSDEEVIVAPSFGSSWGDFNNDGYMDLYISNHYWYPSLYMNINGTGFVDVAKDYIPGYSNSKFLDKHASAWADYNGDGWLDLFEVTGALYGTSSIQNNFFINNGSAPFSEEAVSKGVDYPFARGRTITWIDYDRDGLLDAFVSSQKRSDGKGKSALFKQLKEDHTFIDITAKTHMDIDIKILFAHQTDLDNDGELEFFLISFSFPFKIYHTTGYPFKDVTSRYFPFNSTITEKHKEATKNTTIRWVPPPPETGFFAVVTDVAFADMDRNGWQDVVLARNYGGNCTVTIYYNMGWMDLTTKDHTKSNSILKWEWEDIYTDPHTQCGSMVVADFDNDKYQDIFLVTYLPFTNSPNIYISNKGNRKYFTKHDGWGAGGTTFGKGESVSVADYNNDGYLDLFITNGKGSPPFDIGPIQLFQNQYSGKNWIQIDLIGTRDNPHGFGSRITVTSCKNVQFRDVENGVHFSAQNSFRTHFGLGMCDHINEIKIQWSGSKKFQTLLNIDPNQILRIIQNEDDQSPTIPPKTKKKKQQQNIQQTSSTTPTTNKNNDSNNN